MIRAAAVFFTAAFVAGVASAAGTAPNAVRSTIDPAVMQVDESRFLGTRLDSETRLVDDQGQEFALGELMGKPLILLLSYYGCDGTCPTMNANLAKVLAKVERFRLGQDYRVLTVSIDEKDTPAAAAGFLQRTDAVPDAMRVGWRHAVLQSPEGSKRGVDAFAGSVGVKFFWSDADQMFLHPNVLIFLTPEGRVARYIYGTRMDAKTVELALIDADWNRISNSTAVFDMLTGACFSYNYAEGRYQLNYPLMIGLASWLFGITLVGMGAWIYRRRISREALAESS